MKTNDKVVLLECDELKRTWGAYEETPGFAVLPGTVGIVREVSKGIVSVDWVGYPNFKEWFSSHKFKVAPNISGNSGWMVQRENIRPENQVDEIMILMGYDS